MTNRTQLWPTATVLLTGLSASGKTTLSSALVRNLIQYGITDVVLLDGEEFRARCSRRYGHNLADREAVWRELVKEARRELDSGKVVVVAAIAHRASMRVYARKRLQPFFEVHLDCPANVCAERDTKGHYQRAFASEYECFIGVTHPYEQTEPELRLDTATLSPVEAERLLVERVIHFIATADMPAGPPSGEWLRRLWLRLLVDKMPQIEVPSLYEWVLRHAPTGKPVVRMERASCAQLMVLYSGIDAFTGTEGVVDTMGPLEFLRASGLFGRNIAWIRDPYCDNFARGISPEIPNAEALAEWTRSYASSLPYVREVHAIGYSAGGYGALTFGHLCRMQTVWAFSLRPIHRHEEAMAQLKELLSVHNGVTKYHVWYSALNKRDKDYAEFLAACPGVTVHAYRESGDDHALLRHLTYSGVLRTILPPFLPSEGHPVPRFVASVQGGGGVSS